MKCERGFQYGYGTVKREGEYGYGTVKREGEYGYGTVKREGEYGYGAVSIGRINFGVVLTGEGAVNMDMIE